MDFTVVKLNALSDALNVRGGYVLVKEHVVDLLLEEVGVCELACQVTVVGEEQYAGGVAVQASNGIDMLAAGALDEVHHGLTLLRVVSGGHVILGLVEQDVDLLFGHDGLVVEHYVVRTQHLGSQFGNHFSVHAHHTCCNEVVGFAAAAYACVGKEAVQTDGFVRIDVSFLVLNLLLHAVLGIGIVVCRTWATWPLALHGLARCGSFFAEGTGVVSSERTG